MKVLSPGRKDPNWKKVVSCGPCGAQVEVVRDDLWRKEDTFVGGGLGVDTTHVKCTCGACGADITIEEYTGGEYRWGKLPTKEEFDAACAQQDGATPA